MFISIESLVLVSGLTTALTFMRSKWATGESTGINRIPSSAAYASLICVSGALVYVYFNLDDPSRIGPGIAVAYLSLFYGGLVALAGHMMQLSDTEAVAFTDADQDNDRLISISVGLLLVLISATALSHNLFGAYFASVPGNFLFSLVVTPLMYAAAVQIGMGIPQASKNLKNEASSKQTQSELLRLFGQTAIITGLVGFIIGQIHMMANLSDPKKIGAACALSAAPMFYGLILSLGSCLLLKDENTTSKGKNTKKIIITVVSATLAYMTCLVAFLLVLTALETTS